MVFSLLHGYPEYHIQYQLVDSLQWEKCFNELHILIPKSCQYFVAKILPCFKTGSLFIETNRLSYIYICMEMLVESAKNDVTCPFPVNFPAIKTRARIFKESLVMIFKWCMFVSKLFFRQETQILQEISIVLNEGVYFESKNAIVYYVNSIRICYPEGFGDSRLIFFRLWQNQNFASGYQ